MLKRILNVLFSMELMGLLVIAFAVSAGVATFIENDFGTPAAKAVVYNATWFEILLIVLGINLVANIFRYKMYRREKLTIFIFHLSFIVILIGSGITRFIGYEGIMSIREGATSNTMISDITYVMAEARSGNEMVYTDKAVLLSSLNQKSFRKSLNIDDKRVKMRSLRYIPNAQEMLVRSESGGEPYAVMVVSSPTSGRSNLTLRQGDHRDFMGYHFVFDQSFENEAINLKFENKKLMINTPVTLTTMAMMGGEGDSLPAGEWHPFETRKLYGIGDLRIVLTDIYENGKVDYRTYSGKDMSFMNALIVELRSGNETKEVALRGGQGYIGETTEVDINGVRLRMMYGAKILDLPFSIKLNDFQLERYPGSNSPASYASEVTLIDSAKNVERPYRIFMNNVLQYGGYRFFQSSYDRDELGTVLSVNKDPWGTIVTYLGYFLMTLGMMLALFSRHSRFALMGRLLGKAKSVAGKSTVVLLLMFLSLPVFSQHVQRKAVEQTKIISREHAASFGELLVQDHDGRLKPMNTLASEMLRKVARKNSFNGLNPEQIMLGMLTQPDSWQMIPMIKVTHSQLKSFLGIQGNHAAFIDFLDFSNQGGYRMRDLVSQAYAKKPAERSKFDNDVIAVDERVNISYMVYTGDLLKVLPDPRDSHNPWFTPGKSAVGLDADDSAFIAEVMPYYFMSLNSGDMDQANLLLQGVKNFQRNFGADIMPSPSKTRLEIIYNNMLIFDRLGKYYGLVGVVMLVLVFINLFRERKWINFTVNLFYIVIVAFFLFQTAGLAMRWYIAGRAPWSNGYESMIYIGWVTVLAGLIFSRKSQMTIAATSILASIILMVAHLSWMDPEITNLVPVLKSYWLTIHVSIITASYGFLALGALLGFISLLLMILKSAKNHEHLRSKIRELALINERSLIIGLYLLTIGTFLGGIWANESWGRYWGWDPKETWALVTVLVYTFIAHMGYTPGLKTDYNFALFTLVGFSSVIMTYFGVNYYLSGLHSYAAGDPVPIPTFVYYTLAIIFGVSLWAYLNERRYLKS
jgi:cytochrome c-type biogenesis protein CcsB